MLAAELIERKRDGEELAADELREFLAGYLGGDVAEYQMAAFLMAIFFRSLTPAELTVFTRSIIDSGACLDFEDGGPPAVDKHSTGGVGDKVSLILAPLVAEAGLRVPMMSGRGLGHTGGTLDKLESIPGFRTRIGLEEFRDVLADVGCAMIGQTPEITPLDGKLYALRDVTGTVQSIPLIASSIVSKKVAEGVCALVLDVKCGHGAFMRSNADARELAQVMVDLAAAEGVRATALLTAMDEPLGRTVGNALEVREALACLADGGPEDLREVTLALSAELLVSGGIAGDVSAARGALEAILATGRATERFARLLERQGGDSRVVEDPSRLPSAPVQIAYEAPRAGWVTRADARRIGLAALELGAGRRRVEDSVDPAVGLEVDVRVGARVEIGDPLATIHARDDDGAVRARERLDEAILIEDEAPHPGATDAGATPLVLERIAGEA
jgi:pyrimidine-nucleoside phosphorylase